MDSLGQYKSHSNMKIKSNIRLCYTLDVYIFRFVYLLFTGLLLMIIYCLYRKDSVGAGFFSLAFEALAKDIEMSETNVRLSDSVGRQ